MRNGRAPVLIAPPVGGEVQLELSEELIESLAATGRTEALTSARALRDAGERTTRGIALFGQRRPVLLASGEQLEVCMPGDLIHVRAHELVGDELVAVRAGGCHLPAAPPAALAALGLD